MGKNTTNTNNTNLYPNWGDQFNKYMGMYNKYSPYLRFMRGMSQGGNLGKNAAEAGLDYGIKQIPGVGPIYQGVKTFNDVTGGVNLNKMFHMKNPLTGMWNGLWGTKPKSPEQQQAEDPEYAKYMAGLSDFQNANAATERAALEKRQAIQPMQEKAVSDYMDILQNGLSSRQLAPVYAAGEARNRAIGAGAEAGLMSQVANRGMGGGVQAGLEAAVQANRNALSADLNSRITGQQIAARPGMLGQAANLTMGLENQLQSELAQAGMNRLNAANVGLQAYNAAQTNKRYQQQLDYEKQVAREQEYGALLGKFGPDIAKGIQGLINRGKNPSESTVAVPETTFNGEDASGDWLGTNDTPLGKVPDDWLVASGYTPKGDDAFVSKAGINFDPLHTVNDVSIPPTVSGLGGFNNPTAGGLGLYGQSMSPNMPVTPDVENFLNGQYPYAQQGETKAGPGGATYVKTMFGWQKYYQKNTPTGTARQTGVMPFRSF